MAHEATAVASIKPHNVESQNVDSLVPQQLQGVASNLIGLLKEYYNYMNIDGIPTQLAIIDSDADATELAYDDLVLSDQHLGVKVSGFIPSAYNQIYTQLTPTQVRESGLGATIIYQGVEREEYYIMKLDRARSTAAGSWVMATRINDTVDIDFYDKNWETYPNGSVTDDLYRIEFVGNPGGGGYDDPVGGFSTGGDLTPFQVGIADPVGLLSVDAPEETKIITFTDVPAKGGHGTGLTVDITVDSGKLVAVEVNQPGSGYEIDDDLELDLFYNSGLLSVQETMAGPSNVVRTILEQHDIDKTTDDYLVRIQQEIAKGIPDAVSIDKNTLYKKIVEYYNTRGSKTSVQSFFRIFFDEAVRVVYPKDVLLKPSSGQYTGTATISNTKEKYFYKKGNDDDLDARIEFLQDSNYNDIREGTYFIDFEFGDDFKKGVNAPAVYPTMTGNEAAVFPYTMLFSARNNQTSLNFNSKDFYKGAGVFLQIDANNDLIIKGRFGVDNGQISDFTHTISNYVSGTGSLPFQEPANEDKKRIRMALSVDVRQIPIYQRTSSSGDIVVSGAVASNYNGTYTFNATTNRFVKGDYYFMKEADDHWSFNYSTTYKVRASVVSTWPFGNTPTDTATIWLGSIVETQTWAFNTSGFTEGSAGSSAIYKLGRVRLTTSNFGTTNNSPVDSDNSTNADLALAGQSLSDTKYVNLYPGALGRTYLENSMGGFGHDKYQERPDENPDGEIYFFNFAFYKRFVTDAEAKNYVNNNVTPPNDFTNKIIDIELNNGGGVNFTNKGQNKIIAKNVTGFKTGYTADGQGRLKNAPFKETSYGLSSTGSGYPRNISWKSVKGFLSDINVLHDGDYYQEFSYLIKTSLSSQNWKDAFQKLIHPSGLRFFNALLLEIFRDRPEGKKINETYESEKQEVPVGGILSEDGQDTIKLFRNDYRSDWIAEGIHKWFEPFKPPVYGTHSPKWQYGWFEYLADRLIEIFVYEFAAAWYKQQQFNINNLGNVFYDHEHGLRLRQEKSDFTTLQGNAELTNIDSSQELSYDKKYIELDGNATAIKTGGEITKDSVVELTFKCLQDGTSEAQGKYIAGTKWTGTDGFDRELSIKQIGNDDEGGKRVEVTVTDNGANEITSGTLSDNDIFGIEVTAETFDRRSGEFGIRFNDTEIDCEAAGVLGDNDRNGVFRSSLDSDRVKANVRPNMRGHHLFSFNPTTKVLKRHYRGSSLTDGTAGHNHFDTYGTPDYIDELADFINNDTRIPVGDIVILVSQDASSCNKKLRTALIGCGAEDEQTTWNRARVGHAFIGKKGTTQGAVERIEKNLGGPTSDTTADGNPIVKVTAQYSSTTFKEGTFYPINKQPKFKAKPVVVPLFNDGFTTIRVKGTGEVDRIDPLIGASSTENLRTTDETDSKFYKELVYGNEDYRHRLTHTQPTKLRGNKFLEARLQHQHVLNGAAVSGSAYAEEARGIQVEIENFTLNPKWKAYAFTQIIDAPTGVGLHLSLTEITGNGTFINTSGWRYEDSATNIGYIGIMIQGENATPDQIPLLGSFDVVGISEYVKGFTPSGNDDIQIKPLTYIRETSLPSASNDLTGYLNVFNNELNTRGDFVFGEDWGRADLEIEELTYVQIPGPGGPGNNPNAPTLVDGPKVASFRFKPNSNAAAAAINRYNDSPNASSDPSRAADYAFWLRTGTLYSGGLAYNENGILPEDEKDKGGIIALGLNRDINLGNKTPIEKEAEYEISVKLKNLIQQDDANNKIYIGVQSLDENGVQIQTDAAGGSYNYGVANGELISSNESKTFTGKFKGFNPRTIIPEGEETLTEDNDPLKVIFTQGFGGAGTDITENLYIHDTTVADFATWGGFAAALTSDGSAGETEQLATVLGANPIQFGNAGRIEFEAKLAAGNSKTTGIKFKFERNVFPNTDPSFETDIAYVTKNTFNKFVIDIPARASSLSFQNIVMFLKDEAGEPAFDSAVIIKDITIFDDRIQQQGKILKTTTNRFDPGAKFFNVVILTNHHTSLEREKAYTSLYDGPNGPLGAIGSHVPSTLIKNITIKRTDGKAIKDDKVDRQHEMHGVKKIHDSSLPFLDTADANKNNIKSNTLAIGTINENKSFIGLHSFNDSPSTTTNLLQTNFGYPWKIGAGFQNIVGFSARGTVVQPRRIVSMEKGETTKLILDGTHGYKVGQTINIDGSDGPNALQNDVKGSRKVVAVPESNSLTIDFDSSQSLKVYQELSARIRESSTTRGFTQHDFDKSEINTIYGETPWGNIDVIARTQNLDQLDDLPKLDDAGNIISLDDERPDGGFQTGYLTMNTALDGPSPHVNDDYRLSVYFKFNKVDGGQWYFGTNVLGTETHEIGLGIPRTTAFSNNRRNIIRVDRLTAAEVEDTNDAGIFVYVEGHHSYATKNFVTIEGSTTFSGLQELLVARNEKIEIDIDGVSTKVTRVKLAKDVKLLERLSAETDIVNEWDGQGTLQVVGARNPYFTSAPASPSVFKENVWYIVIAHIFGKGGPTEQAGKPNYKAAKFRDLENQDGIYEVSTGKKIRTCNARQFIGDVNRFRMRTFMWRQGVDNKTSVDYHEPRIEVLDGTELSFEQLLNGRRPESSYPSNIQVQEAFIGGSELGEKDCKYLLTETKQTGNSLAKLTTTSKRYDNNAEIWNTPSTFTGAIEELTLENTLGKTGTTGLVLKGASIADTREFTGNPYTPDFTDSVFNNHTFTNANGGRAKFANSSASDGELGILLGKEFTIRSDEWTSTMNSPNGPAGTGEKAEFHLKFYSANSGNQVCASINPVKPGLNFRKGEVVKIADTAFRAASARPADANIDGLYFVIDDIGRGEVNTNGALANFYKKENASYNGQDNPIEFTRDKAFSNNVLHTPTVDYINDDYHWEYDREYEIEFTADKLYDKNKPANLYIGGGNKIGYYKNLGGLPLNNATGNPNSFIKLKNHGDGPFEYSFVSSTEGFCRIYIAMMDCESGISVAHNGHVLKPVNTDARGEQRIDMRKAPFDYKGGSTKLFVQPDQNSNTNRDGKANREDEMVEFVLESEYLTLGENFIQVFNNHTDGVSGGYIKVEPASNGLVTTGLNTHTICMRSKDVQVPKIILSHTIDSNAHRYTDGENSSRTINNSLVKLNERENTLYEYNWQLRNIVVREKSKRVYHGDFKCIVEDPPIKYADFDKPFQQTTEDDGFGVPSYRPVDTTSLLATDGAIGVGGKVSVPALDEYDTPSDVGQIYMTDKERVDADGVSLRVPQLGVPKGKYGILKFEVQSNFTTHYVSIGENLPEGTLKSNTGYQMTGKVFIPTTNSKLDQVYVMAGVNPYRLNEDNQIVTNAAGLPLYRHPVTNTQIFNSPEELRGFDSYSTTPTNITTKGSWVSFTHNFKVPELFEDEDLPVVRFVTKLKKATSVIRDRFADGSDINGYGPDAATGEKFYLKDIVIKEGIYSEAAKDKESIPSKFHTTINYKDDVSLELDFNSPTLSDVGLVGFDLKHKNEENFYELRQNNNSSVGSFSLTDLPTYESNLLSAHLPFVAQTDDTPVATLNPLLTTSIFSDNSDSPETLTRLGTTPFGSRVVLVAQNNDTTVGSGGPGYSQRDGGFRTTAVSINPRKTYRVSMWVKAKNTDYSSNSPEVTTGENANEGGVKVIRWVGLNDSDVVQNAYNVSNPVTVTTTPSFIEDFDFGKHDTFDSPAAGYTKGLNNNKWFLFVAHIRGFADDVDITNGSDNLPDSGIYIPSHDGRKIRELETSTPANTAYNDTPTHGDWRFSSATTKIAIEAFVKRNARSADDEVEFFAPRIDEVNGLEPTITELTSGAIIEKANIEDFDKKLAITTWNNPIGDTELSIGDYRHAIEGDDFTVSINNTKLKNALPIPEEVREISYGDAVHSKFKTINGLEDTFLGMTIAANSTSVILPLNNTAAMNIDVDWGDGSSDIIKSNTAAALYHTYATAGGYIIKITGDFKKINSASTAVAGDSSASSGDKTTARANFKSSLTSARIGTVNLTQLKLTGCTALASIEFTEGLTNTSGITTLAAAFENCAALKSLDLRGMDTSNVTDFSDFMKQSGAVTGVVVKGLHSLNISSATTLADMFDNVTFNSDELGRTYLAWANNTFGTTPSTLTFDAGNTQYPTGSTADSPNDSPATDLIVDARTTLDTTKSWTITDGGVIS